MPRCRTKSSGCIRARDYDDALAVAETFLHIHPENKSIRRLAALCQQRREPPTHLVPRIVALPHELETTNFDNQSKRLLDVIDGRLPIDQVIDAYANDPQDVILAMFYLHQWVQRRIIEIVTVPAQPV
ncbi:MAG: hypothetical protein IPM54_21250 [Polyangiaceae bacterium]|nr:hypothetical protein [Polyangiaceae bacterium]